MTSKMPNKKKEQDAVVDSLENLAKLRKQRNDAYKEPVFGGCYKQQGHVTQALFPSGVNLNNPSDHNRFAIVQMLIGKLTRYCNNFENGGHNDSLDDISVYSQMLKELDNAQG